MPRTDPALLEELRKRDMEKVVRGKDGWLFLHNDTNRTMDQLAGIVRLTSLQLRRWRLLLELRTAWLERFGIPYFVLIVPNAASVYPEKMPDGFEAVEDRPIHQLLEHLEGTGSFARVLMPLADLIEAKRERLTYIPTDTHWNEYGAFVAYDRLAQELEQHGVDMRRLRLDGLDVREQVRPGDLGVKVEPQETSTQIMVEPREAAARMVADNRVYNNGRNVVYECPPAPGRLFVHGDSFAYAMLHLLAESFARVFFVHRPTLDFDAVLEERPSAVVSVIAERFIVRVPEDLPYVPWRLLARQRREQGAILAPRDDSSLRVKQEIPPHWDPYAERVET
jgi:hypothetical protein